MEYNHLTLLATTLSKNTVIPEMRLNFAYDLTFSTLYPAGLFGAASFKIPRDVRESLLLSGAHRLYLYNGLTLVWEGSVDNLLENPKGGLDGTILEGVGTWGLEMERRGINKRWVDDRLEESVWVWDETATGAEVCDFDRNNRLRFTPKHESWGNGWLARVRYTMPTGQTIKRVVCTAALSETGEISPLTILHNSAPSTTNTFTELTNAFDGDTATTVNVTLAAGDFLYFKRPAITEIETTTGLRFDLGSSVNNNFASFTVQKFLATNYETETPLSVQHDNGGAFTVLTNTFDNNVGTSSTVTITKDDFIYIRTKYNSCKGFKFAYGATVNAVEAEMYIQKYDLASTTWKKVFQREEGTTVKGTNTMKPMAIDGASKLDGGAQKNEETTDLVTVNATAGFWWRISFSQDLTASIVINEIYALTGWVDVGTFVDGTASGSAPLAVDGVMSWDADNDDEMGETHVNAINGLWFRARVSAALDVVTLREIVFQNTSQNFELRLRDTVGSTDIFSLTSTTSGAQDVTLGTPRQYLDLEFIARNNGTPLANGTIYGELTNLEMFSETGNINVYEVANDLRGALSNLSINTTYLDSTATYSLRSQFITQDYERMASVLMRAAAFGNASGAALAFGLKSSQFATDALPPLFLEDWPSISGAGDYDYQVTVTTAQIPQLRRDYASIENWIVIRYTDSLGRTVLVTPDDEATLKDTDSIDRYGQRESQVLDLGACSAAAALAFGVRYLSTRKDPVISMTGPIVIQDYLLHRAGFAVPASEVQAGKRLRILDYEENVTGVITATQYNHLDRTCQMTLGFSDSLAILLARGL